ncbi:hypothetical protein SUDANB70_04567 [Streptomyces sp. enrichment culture]
MRVPRRPRGARKRRASRIPGRPGTPGLPRAVTVPLGCLPGVAAAVALVLCAHGVERAAEATARPAARGAPVHTAPRPHILPRATWVGEDAREQPPPRYDDGIVAVFVHHTDSPNDYACAETPEVIRHLYEGQILGRDFDDIGYNFLVDRCGVVYEGRAGGTDRPVTGAHTQGFNHRTVGIAAIGTFTAGTPVPKPMLHAIATLAAWKLGPSDTDPRAEVRLVSSNGGSRYAAGTAATLPAVAGHNDGYETSCPGAALHARLPQIREMAAEMQGRASDARRETRRIGEASAALPSGTQADRRRADERQS